MTQRTLGAVFSIKLVHRRKWSVYLRRLLKKPLSGCRPALQLRPRQLPQLLCDQHGARHRLRVHLSRRRKKKARSSRGHGQVQRPSKDSHPHLAGTLPCRSHCRVPHRQRKLNPASGARAREPTLASSVLARPSVKWQRQCKKVQSVIIAPRAWLEPPEGALQHWERLRSSRRAPLPSAE